MAPTVERYLENLKRIESFNPLLALQLSSCKGGEALEGERLKVDPDGLELIYCYGMEGHGIYKELTGWLKGNKGRRLLFLEDNLEAFAAFLREPMAEKLLEDRQVEISFLGRDLLEELKQVVWRHLFVPSEFVAVSSRGDDMGLLFEEVKRGAELTLSLYRDFGLGHMKYVFRNLLAGGKVRKGEEMHGLYAGVPGIICGGGASLEETRVEDMVGKGLIFAGGSAMAPLAERGIPIDFGGAIDPDLPEFKLPEGADFPFVYQNCVDARVLDQVKGPRILLGESHGLPLERWMFEQTPFEAGWNVGTFMTHFAHYLGCSPIILVGMDCSEQSEDAIECRDREGNQVWTRSDLLMGKRWFEHLSVAAEMVNCTPRGLEIEGVPHIPLEEVRIPTLKGLKKRWEGAEEYKISTLMMQRKLREIRGSCERCNNLLGENLYLTQAGLEGEIFYQNMLAPLWNVWKHMIQNDVVLSAMENPAVEKKIQETLFFKEITEMYFALCQEF